MFGSKRKKRNNEVKNKQLLTAFDKMEYFIVEQRSNDDLFKICDTILSGRPVLANFDRLTSAADCNFMLSFISGVVYATGGETAQVGTKLYLFARKEEYEDGSLKQYIEDIK